MDVEAWDDPPPQDFAMDDLPTGTWIHVSSKKVFCCGRCERTSLGISCKICEQTDASTRKRKAQLKDCFSEKMAEVKARRERQHHDSVDCAACCPYGG